MPAYAVETPQRVYQALVDRGVITRAREFLPPQSGSIFVVSTREVWQLHGEELASGLAGHPFDVLFFPGGEARKRMGEVEALAEQMAALGADRSSIVVAFGGGIVTDLAGFLAAIFMRGVPLIQIPTTLLAQVDAAVGGKTGANLTAGKNLVGSFHQPLAVLIDPAVIETLPEREYRAGLFEILKHGVIADEELFNLMHHNPGLVFAQDPVVVDRLIADSIRIKSEVVSADEREGDLRRILNFGHTFGHALEAETGYSRFLHGEAVGWGMLAATRLALSLGLLSGDDGAAILDCLALYGAPDRIDRLDAARLAQRMKGDKKTIQGRVHLVLPDRIGHVRIVTGVPEDVVLRSIEDSLAG